MQLVSWNIQHGGGKRHPLILSTLCGLNPDVICLTEFRSSFSSEQISRGLEAAGWDHQLTTAETTLPHRNSLLMAAREPLTRLDAGSFPTPHRFLAARLARSDISVATIHVPNREEGCKYEFHDQVLRWIAGWTGGHCVILGDTNTGQPGLDEEGKFFNKREGAWMTAMTDTGWRDGWRQLHGDARVYSWREKRSHNGFRIDQAFISPTSHALLESVEYNWATQSDGSTPSDHAALIVTLR